MTRLINSVISILALSTLVTPAVQAAQTRYEYQLQQTHPATPMTVTHQPRQKLTSATQPPQTQETPQMDLLIRPVTSGNPYVHPATSGR